MKWLKQTRDFPHDGVFWHECEMPGCTKKVEFDDEPYCFIHTPSAAPIQGYSAYKKARNPLNDAPIFRIPQKVLSRLTKG